MSGKKLTRRDFLRLGALAAAGTALAGCGPSEPEQVIITQVVEKEGETVVETQVVKEEVEVTVEAPEMEVKEIRLAEGSWVGPEGIAYWTDDIIPRFEGENPDIKVTFESAESPDYQDKLFTQAVAGDAPDVFFIWWVGDLLLEEQLLVLDDYFDDEYLSDFYEGNLAGQFYQGHRYGIPKYVSTVCMAYNKDMLDAAGVEYPDGTWTWDDYFDAYQATADPDNGQWGTYVAHGYINHYVWMNGGEWMNEDVLGTECLLDSDEALEALQFNHDLIYGDNPVSPPPGTMGEYGWWDVFSSGKVAFMESHSWTVTNYMRQNEFDWDFVDLPLSPDGGKAGLTFVNDYSVYAGTEAPEASVRLTKFLTSPWALKQGVLGIVGLQPVRKSLVEIWDTESMGARAGYDVGAFSRIMPHARMTPIFLDNSQIQTEIFGPIWDQIWVTGEVSVEDGVNTIVELIDEHFAA